MRNIEYFTYHFIYLISIFLGGYIPTSVAQLGVLSYHYYSPKEYMAETGNWSVVQDNKGILYFGNNRGIIEYNGKKWRTLPPYNVIRTLCKMPDGRILFGGKNCIAGIIGQDSLGKKYSKLLTIQFPIEDVGVQTEIFRIHIANEVVYFQSPKKIFYIPLSQIDDPGTRLKAFSAQVAFHRSFVIHDKLWVQDLKVGIYEISGAGIKLLPRFATLKDRKIQGIFPTGANTYVFATYDSALYEYDGKNLTALNSDAAGFLLQDKIYAAGTLPDGNLALGTQSGGLLFVSKKGKLLRILDQTTNFSQISEVNTIFSDRENNLWLGLNNGIAKIELSPLSRFGKFNDGVKGRISSIIRFANTLYIAGSQGVSLCPEGHTPELEGFQPLEGLKTESWQLFHKNNRLFVAAGDGGVAEIIDRKIIPIAATAQVGAGVFCLAGSRIDSLFFWVGTKKGIAILQYDYKKKKWNYTFPLADWEFDIRQMIETPDGILWIQDATNILYQSQVLPEGGITRPVPVHTLPENSGNTLNSTHAGLSIGVYGYGIFNYNPLKKNFDADTTYWTRELPDRSFDLIRSDISNSIWLHTHQIKSGKKELWIVRPTGAGRYHLLPFPYHASLDVTIRDIYAEPEGVIWIGTDEGLFRYDSRIGKNMPDFQVVITQVSAGNNNRLLYGGILDSIENGVFNATIKPILAYRENSLRFEFAGTSYLSETPIEYQTFLAGYDTTWSGWSTAAFKEYTNLWEGKYTFQVKARNGYQQISSISQYHFQISTPWYRSWWAGGLYILLTIGGFRAILIWNSRRLRAQNLALEKIIRQRTQEIILKNAELEQQKEEIQAQAENLKEINNILTQQKNEIQHQRDIIEKQRLALEEEHESIRESINYARRIQQAMLPFPEQINNIFPENFIYYKPRDIVSGDFYWFNTLSGYPQPNDRIIWETIPPTDNYPVLAILAAADCTGHGVPGAFMSMIGASLLDEIVLIQKILPPNQILNHLNIGVRNALKQEETFNKDGMDISLLSIELSEKNPETGRRTPRKIQFAGANNSIFYVQKQEIIEVKADRLAIGGAQIMQHQLYTNHIIDIDPTEKIMIYMFSDGYKDQNGGRNGRRFMIKNFKDLLFSIHSFTPQKQMELLEEQFQNWIKPGNYRQIDDIMIIGIRI